MEKKEKVRQQKVEDLSFKRIGAGGHKLELAYVHHSGDLNDKRKPVNVEARKTVNAWIRGEGESPALLPGSRLQASGVAVYGILTQVIIDTDLFGMVSSG